jgi:hypothetical protein
VKAILKKSITFAALVGTLAALTACVDPQEEERQKAASLDAMSCARLSTELAVRREKIKSYTEKATVSAIASVFSSGTKSDLNSINSSLSQIARKDLEKEVTAIQVRMAKKGCK